MKVTPLRLLLALGAIVAALPAYFLFLRGDDSLALKAALGGTVTTTGSQFQATGSGTANAPFGKLTLSASGSGQLDGNCGAFAGSAQLATEAGTLQLSPAEDGKACVTQASGETFGLKATVEATGTSGSLLGRHGRLKVTMSSTLEGAQFAVELSGRLKK